jgi:hypothetical protein
MAFPGLGSLLDVQKVIYCTFKKTNIFGFFLDLRLGLDPDLDSVIRMLQHSESIWPLGEN